jgi:hypothetical protein
MFDTVGKAAIRFAIRYVRHRYRGEIRIGAGVVAVAIGAAIYLARRRVPEG